MNTALKTGTPTMTQKMDVIFIAEELRKIYGLGPKECGEYIADYFNSGRFLEFQKLVMLTKEVFPVIGD